MTTHHGGCMCGAVRYRAAADPLYVCHCHCADCRRASGAPLVTWAVFAKDDVSFTQGAPKYRESSERAVRGFCADCGSPLTFAYHRYPEHIDIAAGTLDDPNAVTPDRHVWEGSRLSWIALSDELPRHARGSRDDGD